MKKNTLKKEVINLQEFSEVDITEFPSPEQLLMSQELNLINNIEHHNYYIDGKTVIVRTNCNSYVAFRKNPKSKLSFNLLEYIMGKSDSVMMKCVRKTDDIKITSL